VEETVTVVPRRESKVAQAAGIIALGSVTSRVLGVARETVKAGLFGATGAVSALEVALRVPTLIYDLLVGGMINSALVPVFSSYSRPEQRAELWRLLSLLLSLACVGLSVLILLGEIFAPQIVWLMAGGLPALLQAEAVRLLRIMLPAILLLNIAGILAGALYALERFTFPAFTATVFNAAIVALALALGPRIGVTSMAIGLLIGAVSQILLQAPGLRDAELRFDLSLDNVALRRVARLYVPIGLGLVVDMIGVALSYNLASRTGDQSIPWMQYSATLIQFPLGLVSIAISMAILPTLSRQAAEGADGDFRDTLAYGLRLVVVLIIPATVGLFVLAVPLVRLVFEHGDFTFVDTRGTVEALRCHLAGLVFAAIDQPLIFACYARKETWKPALVGVVTVLLYVLLALLPTLFVPLTLNGLILANSFKWMAHALVMLFLVRRDVGSLHFKRHWRTILKVLLASLTMGVAVYLVLHELEPHLPATLIGEIILAAAGMAAGLGVYGGATALLGVREMASLIQLFVQWGRAALTLPQPTAIMTQPEEDDHGD
jgi:putative peptidoglycan lipid II flippase